MDCARSPASWQPSRPSRWPAASPPDCHGSRRKPRNHRGRRVAFEVDVSNDEIEDIADPTGARVSPGLSSPPVAIVGMHRSGTSMVAKVLQQAGLHLGTEADLMPPAAENPEGFFEHLGFVRLNDDVLNAAGSGWDCPPRADIDWGSGAFEPFR